MRIGINGLFQASGGSLKNLSQLMVAWKQSGVFGLHEFVLFASPHTHERLASVLPAELTVHAVPFAGRGLVGRMLAEQIILPRLAARHEIQVLFCPANTLPLWTKVPCVVTFQNAAPLAPEIRRCRVGWRERLRWIVLGKLMRAAARRASRIIFISHYFQDLLSRECSLDVAKGTVIYRAREGSAKGSQRDPTRETQYSVRQPYLLTVSHLYPYKNILELVAGFALARKSGHLRDVQLVIAGGVLLAPRYHAQIKRTIARSRLSEREVLLTGDVPPEDIKPLLAGCEGFVFSSVCENCPTGLVEALSLGRAIACSNVGVMPEVAGDAAVYFDPFEPEEIAAALIRLVHEPGLRQQLAARGLAQARRFPDSAEVARQTLRAIESAAGPLKARRAA